MAVFGKEQVRFAFQLLADDSAALAALLARAGTDFAIDGAEALATAIGAAWGREATHAAVADMLARYTTPLSHFVAARLEQQAGRRDAALALFQLVANDLSCPEPFVLLHQARLLADLGREAEAIAALRQALALHPPYGFTLKAEKLVARLMRSPHWVPRRSLKLAVIGSSTTAMIAGPLLVAGFRDGIAITVYEGAHGGWRQEVLDPASGLAAFGPEITLILVNSRDLGLAPAGGAERVEALCQALRQGWRALRQTHACHVIQVLFDLPDDGAWGPLEDQLPDGRRRLVATANARLAAELPASVSLLDPLRVASLYGGSLRSDEEWARSKQYPAAAALPAFADLVLAQCRAVLGLSAKVLALDLDNTLWGGVIGEDGVAGIKIGPPDAVGELHQAIQDYALDLKARGVVLAAISKNNPDDAEAPFRHHDGMRLKLEDFVAFRANWDDKASNLEALAAQLGLGVDSIVFLDDNPLERNWVRARLPDVTVVEGGADPATMLAALKRGLYFESVALTEDDHNRHASYLATSAVKALEHAPGTAIEDFLAELGMIATHGPVDGLTLARVTQLLNKTNQFNLTTRRATEAEIAAMAASPDWWCRWFRLADRFGDHGLIGLVFARTGPVWEIDTWLMSCRVLGRRMEDFMASRLLAAAAQAGAAEVRGRYLPSAKNGQVADLLPRLGFAATGEPDLWRWDLAAFPAPPCPFIREGDHGTP